MSDASPAFDCTGEFRRPRLGEWFVNWLGKPVQADRDYQLERFPILKERSSTADRERSERSR